MLDHRLGVPLGSTAVPLSQPHLTAEVQHQRLIGRRRVKLKAHRVQLGFGGREVGPEPPQILDQHQRVLLLFVEPHAHEGRKVGIVAVVTQKHLGGRKGRPLGDRVVFDGSGLLVAQQGTVEAVPGHVIGHVPTGLFQRLEQIRVEHGGSRKNQSMYSKTLTTLLTPVVEAESSAAAEASSCLTKPIR